MLVSRANGMAIITMATMNPGMANAPKSFRAFPPCLTSPIRPCAAYIV